MNKGVKTWLGAVLLCSAPALWAGPTGYSVNSDEPDGDKLHAIDLMSGAASPVGAGLSLSRTDVEGLAFDNQNVLWGVDDDTLRLFPIDTATGQGIINSEVSLTGLTALQGNDFGLTFTCDAELYVTSVSTQTLYRVNPDGNATAVGGVGKLGQNISAITSWGSPARLYGLSNGMLSEEGPRDSRSLYSIDPLTGAATLIGPIGDAVGDYLQAGLSFDGTGALWAITDRRFFADPQGSQVLSINPATGAAIVAATTAVTGFESLAVSPPGGCGEQPIARIVGDPNQIPTLDGYGKLLAVLMLMLVGGFALQRRDQR